MEAPGEISLRYRLSVAERSGSRRWLVGMVSRGDLLRGLRRVSLGRGSPGQMRAYVWRLASKYSRIPSQRTQSKSRASTSGGGATELAGDDDLIRVPEVA